MRWKVDSQWRGRRQIGKRGFVICDATNLPCELRTNHFNYEKDGVKAVRVGESSRPGRSKLVTKEQSLSWFHGQPVVTTAKISPS